MAGGRARQRDPMRRFEVLAGKGGPPWLAGGLQGHGGASVFPGIEKRNRRGFREKKNGDSGRRRTVEEGWLASSAHAIRSKGSYQTRQPQQYSHDNLMGDNSQNLDRALCFTGLQKIISIVLQRESIRGTRSTNIPRDTFIIVQSRT
uniref:Uncharacterized protein n=1 Tax=Triticum urartu TaxID=4572 RepID=A0A8R7UGH1_TRIUA